MNSNISCNIKTEVTESEMVSSIVSVTPHFQVLFVFSQIHTCMWIKTFVVAVAKVVVFALLCDKIYRRALRGRTLTL